MRSPNLLAFPALAIVAMFACSPTPPSEPSPVPAPGGGVAAAPAGAVAADPGPGAVPARRRPPSPMQQDTLRRAMVDSILRSIAGRENEPAGAVFKNVTLLKDMKAREFLATMSEQYGRGLGWTCNNCHVIGKFDDDSRKNKKIARQMQVMVTHINEKQLTMVKELDKDYNQANCVMCHRGAEHAKGEMPPLGAAPAKAP